MPKFIDASKGDRGRLFVDGVEVLAVRAKLGWRGWIEVIQRDDRGFVRLNRARTRLLRKRIKANYVEFIKRVD